MKIHFTRHLLAPLLAATLPCLAFGQASSPSSASPQKERTLKTPSPSAIDSSRDVKDAMHLVTQNEIDAHMTAKSLIGTDVHGADGNKIGSVVDVILASSVNTGMKSMHSAAKGDYDRSSARTDKALSDKDSVTGTAATEASTASTTAARTSGKMTAPDTRRQGMSTDDHISSSMGRDHMQTAVVISTGGLFGVGSDLIQVPLSKINYDADKKEIRLNVSEPEWQALRDGIARGNVTSTR